MKIHVHKLKPQIGDVYKSTINGSRHKIIDTQGFKLKIKTIYHNDENIIGKIWFKSIEQHIQHAKDGEVIYENPPKH